MNDIIIPTDEWNPASARINKKNMSKLIGILSDEERIKFIIRLITYLYIRPFLRFAFLAFLILFRCYHSIHPEIISARMNESFLIRSFWSNYYTNPGFLSIVYQPIIYSRRPVITSSESNIQTLNQTLLSSPNFSSNKTIPIEPTLEKQELKRYNPIQYHHNSYFALSNSRSQVVFNKTPNYIEKKKLLPPVITSLNNTMMLVDFNKPVPAKASFSSNKSISTVQAPVQKDETKSKMISQITIGKPMASLPIKSTDSQKTQRSNSRNSRNAKTYKKTKTTKRSSKRNSKDFIYGYIIEDKGIAVIYENGIPHIYKLPKDFLNKYLAEE